MNFALMYYVYSSVKTFTDFLLPILLLVVLVSSTLCLLTYGEREDSQEDKLHKLTKNILKPCGILTAICFIIFCFTPSRSDMKVLVGVYVADNIVEFANNSEEMQKLPNNILSSLNSFLEEVRKVEEEQADKL